VTSKGPGSDAVPVPKQEYVKPSFRTINLVAEEVMVVGCKLPASGGPLGGGAGTCTIPTPCNQFSGVS
jgi:hypothetical protein